MKFLICLFGLYFLNMTLYCYSQSNVNFSTCEQYEKADKRLNITYQKILEEYKKDTVFINSLKKSQRIWILFRDSELKMKYPENDVMYNYGSMYTMCVCSYLEELTLDRIKKLELWLLGVKNEEGCNGSIKNIM